MTTYIANAVDIPAIISNSNGDYVRTGGAQALYAASDGKLVTYLYTNGLAQQPSISGGFEPLLALASDDTLTSVTLGATLSFVNPTSVAGSLGFSVMQPTTPDVLCLFVTHAYSTFSSGFATTADLLTKVSVDSLRLGALRWTVSWANFAVLGQSLTIDRIWLDVETTSSLTALTAPVFSTGQSRFDIRKDWTITG